MQIQEDRDAKTLDIMSAVIGATVIWGLPTVLIVWIASASDVDVRAGPILPVFFVIGYVATIVLLITRRKQE